MERAIQNHYLPVEQIASSKAADGENPGDLATLLDWQVGRATDPEQKITLTMNLQGAMSLAKLLRRAGLAGL